MAAGSTHSDRSPAALLAHAAARGMRAQARAALPTAALFAPQDPIDDRTRAAMSDRLERLVQGCAERLADRAAARLEAAAEPALAARLRREAEQVWERLTAIPALWDEGLLAELLAETRLALLAAGLPERAPFHPDQPSLLARLAHSEDATIAEAAKLLLLHGSGTTDAAGVQQLWWPIAAALRARTTDAEEIALLDRALTSAVEELRGQDADAPAAARLARALRRDVATLPELVEHALSDRRLELAVALVADAGGLGPRAVRDLVLERDPAPLLILLRAVDLPRATLARIVFALCEADPARDLDHYADVLDEVAAVPLQQAWQAVAAMALPAGYRAALLAFAESRPA
ncbi:DUF2336 domain-containing protein [Sphingomonas sp. 3-13AW]|jgi:hypothetical protein|uniref:DUF2336 domain-containing protein n=1 Tax=Sphingomonas sp. 3-13AW TaxID=3050450 RepID=UPI003BB75368